MNYSPQHPQHTHTHTTHYMCPPPPPPAALRILPYPIIRHSREYLNKIDIFIKCMFIQFALHFMIAAKSVNKEIWKIIYMCEHLRPYAHKYVRTYVRTLHVSCNCFSISLVKTPFNWDANVSSFSVVGQIGH